ncbi:MAG: response regulator [Thermoguttaceae bacterium]|nr:response regulator [Thermoguttaceae bacterium]MBQ2682681.1 response regulator [Thermoguttaceae bacterium]MBQ3454415.1 response regulator [Thermoguttaceae bacterium]MBQ6619258.1 response regulator [Thermoguttaceae bacterium]MBR2585753.1 response regulator [Thermoguttaceae bacterium]
MSTPEREKKLILVVDDDPEISETIRSALVAVGYDVILARDGNLGLVICERMKPDMILLDMMMPKRSGFLVLEALRQSEAFTSRVIMITGNDGNRHRDYAHKLGVDAYIRKPFPMDLLLTTVEKVFRNELIRDDDE